MQCRCRPLETAALLGTVPRLETVLPLETAPRSSLGQELAVLDRLRVFPRPNTALGGLQHEGAQLVTGERTGGLDARFGSNSYQIEGQR